jgi:hypothetical protein
VATLFWLTGGPWGKASRMAWIVVIGTVVAVVALVVVLARQGNPADLSEQAGNEDPNDAVVERPAGPDAEATGVADSGASSPAPEQER